MAEGERTQRMVRDKEAGVTMGVRVGRMGREAGGSAEPA